MRLSIVLSALILVLMGISGCISWSIEQKYPPIGAFIDSGENRIHYVDMGPRDAAGPPIVLIHGASANMRDMKTALGDQLARRYRVIAVDRPGRGYSTRPRDGYRLEVQARLIRDALRDLGIEKPLIVGQSLGGAVALAYTLQYQDEISGAVYLAAVSHEWPGGVTWYNTASELPGVGFVMRRAFIPIYGPVVAEAGVDGSFWPNPAPDNYIEATALPLLFRPRDFQSNAADIVHLKAQIKEMMRSYGEITVPVRIFTGTHDTTVSPTLHSYTLSEQVKDGELTFLDEEGHGLHHTASREIIAGIDTLIAEILAETMPQHDDEDVMGPADGPAKKVQQTDET